MTAFTDRERVYDDEISPLVSKVIALCREHDIPLVFSCQLNDDREELTDVNDCGEEIGPFFCTTILVNGDATGQFAHTHRKLRNAAAAVRPEPPPSWAAYTIVDGVSARSAGSDDGYDPGAA